jgi:hypothetical protein
MKRAFTYARHLAVAVVLYPLSLQKANPNGLKRNRNFMKTRMIGFATRLITTTLAFTALYATSAGAQHLSRTFTPASTRALPGLQCKLYPDGNPSAAITVFTDDDGYARFHAVRAAAGDRVQRLTMDCTDSTGSPSRYYVDLTADDTFAPRPINLANERGTDRPALTDDPLSYSQAELIQAGYGLRPDPKDAAAYSRWLAAAKARGRTLEIKRASNRSWGVEATTASPWTGSVLTGDPNYISIEGTFNVPKAIPGGDGTTNTHIAIWNGLGGYGTGSGLIQGGAQLDTSGSVATYLTFREYCCGDKYSNGYGGAFVPNPGDQIYSQEWYCDSKGNLDLKGGYGCTFLHDTTTGAILNCTVAGGSPCWSVPAYPLCSVSPKTPNCMTIGRAAESIIELQGPAFTDFGPKVTMTGSAYSSKTGSYSQTISTDPQVSLLWDFTKAATHIAVTLGATNQTYFSIEPGVPSYPLYCQGPLVTSSAPVPLTPFKWSSHSASAASPGPGECAWADRGPGGTEIKSGNSNVIYGYLNQVANLRAGKYAEIGVYNDASVGNDMVVTQVVGLVTPPFSSSSTLP